MTLRRAFVVADLAFGDAGKGTIVDWLVREHAAPLVVRWNGGAQAGHTVVLDDGRHHTFSQFGAGTFVPGVRTHLAEPVVIHPTGLLVEARRLAGIGVGDALARLTIAASARVITPYHQAANQLRELARGAARHGTCGIGVGEAVRDALAHPDDAIRACDLAGDPGALRAKLGRVRERVRASLGEAGREPGVFDDDELAARWLEAIAPVRDRIVADAALDAMLGTGAVVLEGAQGVLLDEHVGFHPHTTWSTCTTDAATTLLAAHGWREAVERIGVLRTYATRHGEGPFPTADAALDALTEPHNASDGWQGAFRRGWPDRVLARYALAVSGGIDTLAITHLDRLAACEVWRAARAYRGIDDDALVLRDATGAIDLRAGDLDHQARLTRALSRATPIYEPIPRDPDAYVAWIEAALATPVRITSSGPTARDKQSRGAR